MRKFTDSQKQVFKRLVLDTILQRLDTDESLDYINTKLKAKYGIEIGEDYFKHVKADLRRDSQNELEHLRKNRLSYVNQLFIERKDELKAMQRRLWEIIIDNQKEKPDVAIRSVAELHKLSQSLSQMYEMLPFLCHLPSDAFSGFTDNNYTTPKPTPPFDIGGGNGGMYRLKHSVDLANDQHQQQQQQSSTSSNNNDIT